jgi:hypothetical protein
MATMMLPRDEVDEIGTQSPALLRAAKLARLRSRGMEDTLPLQGPGGASAPSPPLAAQDLAALAPSGGQMPVLRADGVPPPPQSEDPNVPEPPGPRAAVSPVASFTADDNLRTAQINPQASERLRGIQRQVDAARARVAEDPGLRGFQGVDAPDRFDASPEGQRARQLTSQALEAVGGGKSRLDIALERLRNLDEATADARTRGIRDIGDAAARFGRIGSGVVTTDLGNLEERLQQNRDRELRTLAADAAEGDIGDRLRNLEAIRAAGGQVSDEDLRRAGFDQGLREEQRGERGAGLEYDLARSAEARARLGAVSGQEGDVFGREQAQRDELRGERGYQEDQANEAFRQRLAEEQFRQGASESDQDYALRRAMAQASVGFSGRPDQTLLEGAGQQSDAAGQAFDAMQGMLQERGAAPAAPSLSPASTTAAGAKPVGTTPAAGSYTPGVATPPPTSLPRIQTPAGMPGYRPTTPLATIGTTMPVLRAAGPTPATPAPGAVRPIAARPRASL